MTPLWTLHQADARHLPLADRSIYCCVTSPPYWQLRLYRGQGDAGIGLEATVEEYLEHLLEVFGEVWRVLRDDGCLFVNIGDTRGHGRGSADSASPKQLTSKGTLTLNPVANDLNLYGIPERFALAMQGQGWTWRDTIIWHKQNPMPESVSGTRWERCRVKVDSNARKVKLRNSDPSGRHDGAYSTGRTAEWASEPAATWADCPGCAKCAPNGGLVLRRGSWRCTDAWEHIFMFVKGPGYFADGEGERKAAASATLLDKRDNSNGHRRDRGYVGAASNGGTLLGGQTGLANLRNVWVLPMERGVPGHYAQFPPSLPARCIEIATSEKGVCPECGAQWARVVSTHPSSLPWTNRTLAWRPTCRCNASDPVPATVLDPFAGVGPTLLAASRMGRRSIGVDLSAEYLALARQRLDAEAPRF